MLTGQRLFRRLPDVAFKSVPAISHAGLEVNELVQACLKRDVDQRIQSADELLQRLNLLSRQLSN